MSYKISFNTNTKFYEKASSDPNHPNNKDPKTSGITLKNQEFTVELNPKTLYPFDVKQTEKGSSFSIRDQNGVVKNFNDTHYTRNFTVDNILGILVAEQLRFNTLDLEMAFIEKSIPTVEDLFYFIYDKYKAMPDVKVLLELQK